MVWIFGFERRDAAIRSQLPQWRDLAGDKYRLALAKFLEGDHRSWEGITFTVLDKSSLRYRGKCGFIDN
ncbi:hypothetical protein J6590_001613 [Homalodisca vitripennis]|nr:hypothetical protein J6590_001613 [Homalodisca vitripennis]